MFTQEELEVFHDETYYQYLCEIYYVVTECCYYYSKQEAEEFLRIHESVFWEEYKKRIPAWDIGIEYGYRCG